MCLDNFQPLWSREEIKDIQKRVLESSLPDQEQDFYQFFEQLRKKSELYACIMFRGLRLLHFDKKARFVIVRGQSGEEVRIDLY